MPSKCPSTNRGQLDDNGNSQLQLELVVESKDCVHFVKAPPVKSVESKMLSTTVGALRKCQENLSVAINQQEQYDEDTNDGTETTEKRGLQRYCAKVGTFDRRKCFMMSAPWICVRMRISLVHYRCIQFCRVACE